MKESLLKKLLALNPTEKLQAENHCFIPDFSEKSILGKQHRFQIPVFTPDFFNNRKVYICKHNRFADYPLHAHTFLEINYMVTGQAREIVSGKPLTLHQGDILVLDVGTPHAIKALGKNDLLLNILFGNNIDFSSLKKAPGQSSSIQPDFLISNSFYSQYLIYRNEHTDHHVQILADLMIDEFFHPQQFASQLMDSYLNCFMLLLARNTKLRTSTIMNGQFSSAVAYILREISQHYQSLSLSAIAQKMHYSRSYLGALFKKETGSSFSKALTEQRLLSAYYLLAATKFSVSEVMAEVGISNKTFFYKQFKAKFGKTPKEVKSKQPKK